ncbi:hypothetical protein [Nonomuraea sp. NPDC049750]|uniref:hypothetical protein n=1 Tax=Nonomuraea sp. NPDC049750 TaxID=3154738 RepID=UPI00340A5226
MLRLRRRRRPEKSLEYNPLHFRKDPRLPKEVQRLLKSYERDSFHRHAFRRSDKRERLATQLRHVWPSDSLDIKYLESVLAVLDLRAVALYSKESFESAETGLVDFWAANGLERQALDEVLRTIHLDLITILDH